MRVFWRAIYMVVYVRLDLMSKKLSDLCINKVAVVDLTSG